MRLEDVIQRPLVTEKAARLREVANEYFFAVHPKANKRDIQRAVEKFFQVKVVAVQTIQMPSKRKRFKRGYTQTSAWKKAMVKLHAKDTIKLFEGQS